MRCSVKNLSTFNSSGSLLLLVTGLSRIMKVFRCIFPCVFFIIYMVICKENSVKWLRYTTMDVTYGTSTRVEGALSTSQCMASCSATIGCESFNVQRDKLQCELSTHHPAKSGLTVNERPGWTVYYKAGRNCKDLLDKGVTTNGFQTIMPDDINPVRVLCVMNVDGGGWTVIQKRESATNFYQNWQSYRNGFGDDTDFWLGLENIHRLSAQGNYELRVDMTRFSNARAAAKYQNFSVGSETTLYELSISSFSFDPALEEPQTSFLNHTGMKFSTYDNDNDAWSSGNCAVNYKGGHWYSNCHINNLNGLYGSTDYGRGINWSSWTGFYESLKYTRMMIRPTN